MMTFEADSHDDDHIIPGMPGSTSLAAAATNTDLNYARFALSQLVEQEEAAEAEDSKGKTKFGLCDSVKMTVDIIDSAQRAKSHRKTCIFIAEQAYQLVNAVDAGIKGGVLDKNDVLREHIARLNVDLNQIRQTIRRFGSWWIFLRFKFWSGDEEKEMERCREMLERGMDMYVVLLRSSLAQPEDGSVTAIPVTVEPIDNSKT